MKLKLKKSTLILCQMVYHSVDGHHGACGQNVIYCQVVEKQQRVKTLYGWQL